MKKKLLYVGGLLVALLIGVGVGNTPSTTKTSQSQDVKVEATQTPLPTSTPTKKLSPTIVIVKPTATPIPTKILYPTNATVVPTEAESSPYSCNCSKTCTQMSSCAEAQFQLNNCGCGARDGDNDGIACDSQCQ